MNSPSPLATAGSTASILLGHIAENERSTFLSNLISSLQSHDSPGISLVAQIVATHPEGKAAQKFIDFLDNAIREGHVRSVVAVVLQYQELALALLSRAVDVAAEAKSRPGPDDALLSYLLFSRLTASRIPWSEVHSKLLQVCLETLDTESKGIHDAARDVVLELLAAQTASPAIDGALAGENTIWHHIRTLLASELKHHIITAYSIWLRWLLGSAQSFPPTLFATDYWQLIRNGLRHGDAEQRKLCLNILKLTVVADAAAVPEALRPQYDRYATVFETIVLGRYLNQVIECEPDLNFLAKRSDLDPRWLFALLGASLDSRMQDSNRKFIGNWVMHAGLNPGLELLSFFRDDFLPWATQGQHFVSTLKREKEHVVCRHGENLAALIKSLRRGFENPSLITDIVFEAVMKKKNSMFAYCTVYLLNGLEDSLNAQQTDGLVELRGLPEVARDYVLSKTSRTGGPENHSKRQQLELRTVEKMNTLGPDAESLADLWSDVEYLEFPKRLLMSLPAVFLGKDALQAARQDSALGNSLSVKLGSLLKIAETKAFLFPPLAAVLRKAVMLEPDSIEFLNVATFLVCVAEKPPEPTIDLMLEEAIIPLTSHTYQHYFGHRLSYGYAAYLDLVSRLGGHQDVLKKIIDHIMDRWISQKVPPPTISVWKNALQLQVLMLCLEQYELYSSNTPLALLQQLFHLLAIEPLPSYRYLLEAIIVRLLQRHNLADSLIERLETKDHHSNPKHLASLMKIGAILACSPESTEVYAQKLATTFVPLAASSKVVIRHEAQWQIPLLIDHARSSGWRSIINDTAIFALDDYIRSLERFHDPPSERQMGRFDPAHDYTITNLAEGRWLDLDSTDAALTSHADFLQLSIQDTLPQNAPISCIPLGHPIVRPASPSVSLPVQPPNQPPPPGPQTADTVNALQTKGTAHLARTLTNPITRATRPHPTLLVVASLVANPHNLGGLSRVSEAFGAGALTLQNQNVLGSKDFLSVAVSSHLHIPIIQLSAAGVPGWLRERKEEGFTVVGIEQTDRSEVLGAEGAVLPGKCVLVVGSEREGIPAAVLVECGVLVEIEQGGVTRSLNVQTAVGVVLFEWGRQRGREGRVQIGEGAVRSS